MDILRSYRRRNIEKKIRRMKIIQNFLEDPSKKKWIKKIICESISNLNRKYFGDEDLIDVLYLDVVSSEDYLRSIRDESFIVLLFHKHDLLNHIVSFNSFEVKKSLKQRINMFFQDFPLLEDFESDLRDIRDNFFKKTKEAEKLYSTALNKTSNKEKISLLEKALVVSQWGSFISVKILQALILIKSGERLGKSEKDKRKDEENKKRQKIKSLSA